MRSEHHFRPSGGLRSMVKGTLVFAALVLVASQVRAQFTMSLPTSLTANPGQTISIPVSLNILGNQINSANGNGIGAASFVISYDTNLSSSVGSFTLGSLISNPSYDFSDYTTNNTAGLIRAVTTSTVGTPGLDSGTSGTLALISFTISPSAAPGDYTLNLLPSSGATTSSFVDNNFNTYDTNSGLTLVNGSVTVTPEPGSLLLIAIVGIGLARIKRRRETVDGLNSTTKNPFSSVSRNNVGTNFGSVALN